MFRLEHVLLVTIYTYTKFALCEGLCLAAVAGWNAKACTSYSCL